MSMEVIEMLRVCQTIEDDQSVLVALCGLVRTRRGPRRPDSSCEIVPSCFSHPTAATASKRRCRLGPSLRARSSRERHRAQQGAISVLGGTPFGYYRIAGNIRALRRVHRAVEPAKQRRLARAKSARSPRRTRSHRDGRAERRAGVAGAFTKDVR